ncbi:MAG: family 16 glycosylhydrolase [Clostridia bacterium]|nr:family 16 glycosylhydrolase [Clostridia bacterium]
MKRTIAVLLVIILLGSMLWVWNYQVHAKEISLDLISYFSNGSNITDPTHIEDTGNGFIITQSGGWNVWVMHYDVSGLAEFTPDVGETVYLSYDFTVNGSGHVCAGEWTNSLASAIAAEAGVDTTPADDGTPMLVEGTYAGSIAVDKSIFRATGRFGIVGTGAVIRKFQLVSAGSNGTSKLGDLNEDGDIDMKDVLAIRKHIMDPSFVINTTLANVNRDEEIDMKDVLLIRKYIAKVITSFEDQSQGTSSVSSTTSDTTSTTSGSGSSTIVYEKGTTYLKSDGSFYDDFTNGVDSNMWYLCTQTWGGGNNGQLAQNVGYTEDGTLVLTANGDLYKGTIGGRNGKRTGGVIVSKSNPGPGSYEVRMKVAPRLGTCSTMWTFYYGNNGENHEIDIEIPGNETTFKYSLFTNWLTEENYLPQNTIPDFYHNDGEWHTYRFDWHTNPKRIDYYVDGKLEMTSNTLIPTIAGHFWLGVWFPNAWCGNPDFETCYMLVDYAKFTAFDEPFTNSGIGYNFAAPLSAYPASPMQLPTNNYVSNGSFVNDLIGWTVTGSASVVQEDGDSVLKVMTDETKVTQKISSMISGGQYLITGTVKTTGNALIEVTSIKQNGSVISTQSIPYTSSTTLSKQMTLPEGTAFIQLGLSGTSGTTFDDLYVTQPSRHDF